MARCGPFLCGDIPEKFKRCGDAMSVLYRCFFSISVVVLLGISQSYAMQPNSRELCEAAGYGDARAVEACLARGDAIDGDDGLSGMTPVAHAASEGRHEMVRFLLERGADPDQPDNQNITPLFRLLGKQYDDEVVTIATLLIGAGAQEHDVAGQGFWNEAKQQDRVRKDRSRQLMNAPCPARRRAPLSAAAAARMRAASRQLQFDLL